MSCTFFVNPKEIFIVKNEADKDINISFFSKSVLIESIKIDSHKQYEKTINVELGSTTSPFDEKTDSLIIQFSDNKYFKQYCQGFTLYGNFDKCYYEKNLLDFATGSYSRNNVSGKVFRTITFDNSDYVKAKL